MLLCVSLVKVRGMKVNRPLWDCNRKTGKGDSMGYTFLFRQLLKKRLIKNESEKNEED